MITLGKRLLQRGFGNHPLFGTILLLFNMIGVGWLGHLAYQQGNFPTSSGGGISQVSSLPATCTPGQGYSLPTGGVVFCAANGTSYTGGLENAIQPSAYGVTMNAKMCRDSNAQFTTTTSVTCPTANFTSADVGKIIFGTCCGLNGGANHPASTLILPQSTILTVNSSTNVTVGSAGTVTTCAAGASGCLLIWGTDDSTAWDNVWTAATGTAGHCFPIQMGGGMSLIQTGKFLSTVCNTGITGTGSQGASIVGLGYKASQFVPTPNFNAATCNGTGQIGLNNVCFGPGQGFQLINAGIWGGEYGNTTNFNGKIFVDVGIDSYLLNTLFAGLASGAGTMIGVQFESSGQTPSTMIVDGFGGFTLADPSCNVIGGIYNVFVNSFCGNTGGVALNVASGATLTDYGGFYNGGTTSNSTLTQNGTFKGIGTLFASGYTGAGTQALVVANANSLTYLTNAILKTTGTANDTALFFTSASAKVWSLGTQYTGGSANHDIGQSVMGTFFDLGGNTFNTGPAAGTILPTCVFTSGGGTTPSCTLQAGSTNEKGTIIASTGTGSPQSSGTITLTFAGTFAGASGAVPSCTFTINNSGTAWGAESLVQINTQSTTAPVIAWVNIASIALTPLAVSSPYRIDYTCGAK
jgi:hypothetical protein